MNLLLLAAFSCLATVVVTQSNQHAMNLAQQENVRPNVQAQATGNNARHWDAGVQAGVGGKVWESDNRRHSVGVGASYGQGFARRDQFKFQSKPDYGVGLGYRFRF